MINGAGTPGRRCRPANRPRLNFGPEWVRAHSQNPCDRGGLSGHGAGGGTNLPATGGGGQMVMGPTREL
jgi:hypothetical protein